MAKALTSCLALTMGDPSGIGPELSLKAWLSRRSHDLPPFVYIGNEDHLKRSAEHLALDAAIGRVETPADAFDAFNKKVPVIDIELKAPVEYGKPNAQHATAVIKSLDRAIAYVMNGSVGAIVTNPIHKKTMWDGGFRFPGHTEYLADKVKNGNSPADVVMMLAIKGLRVVPVTIHVPLKDVSASLDASSLVRIGMLTSQALTCDFGIEHPRLGVAGLNPHAGEDAALGSEERDIIAPAVEELRKAGIEASGPYPADTLFSEQLRTRFDAIICMYHDQALIPLKAIDFDRGINVTLGLPFVRTSPDHGTAHDIAGQGLAKPDSLIMALKTAHQIAERRATS